ncbi:MAG TPA: MFS transporter [Pyrinomonadaceae bacterium]|jgi:ACS family hexuronate transporter-like MFS transporter|nr:MFS transporter [Pyrinomonadaceae bacterium]
MGDINEIVEEFEEPKSLSEVSPPEEAAATATGAVIAAIEEKTPSRVGNFRWAICSLLFFAATVNYIDRQVIGILKPTLAGEFGWTELDYSWIVFSFQTAYAIGLLFVGKLMDKIGTKKGFALAIVVWSVAAIGHAWAISIGTISSPIVAPIVAALVSAFNGISSLFGAAPWTFTLSISVIGFMVVRFALGLGEAGNFPASIKTVAEWFPKKERALATGIFNAGTNVGALATPLLVPIIVLTWGWFEAFIFTGVIGFIWLFFWLLIYKRPEEHKRLSAAELAYIQSDPAETPELGAQIPWRRLFPHRQTWAFGIGKFLTDPIWWIYLFWLPDFLNKQHGLDLKNFGIPLAIIYIIADIGSVGGGYISSKLIKRGWTINRSRKFAMLICALAVVPIVFASITSNLWIAVILIGIAAAAHQGWSANIFTIASDMFPKQAVGSVVGIGGMMGAVGGMVISPLVGWILYKTGSYLPIFIIAASAYLIALLIIHLLAPKLEPANINYE